MLVACGHWQQVLTLNCRMRLRLNADATGMQAFLRRAQRAIMILTCMTVASYWHAALLDSIMWVHCSVYISLLTILKSAASTQQSEAMWHTFLRLHGRKLLNLLLQLHLQDTPAVCSSNLLLFEVAVTASDRSAPCGMLLQATALLWPCRPGHCRPDSP